MNCSMWIPVDPVRRHSTLEFVAGSHRGPWLMPRSFMDQPGEVVPRRQPGRPARHRGARARSSRSWAGSWSPATWSASTCWRCTPPRRRRRPAAARVLGALPRRRHAPRAAQLDHLARVPRPGRAAAGRRADGRPAVPGVVASRTMNLVRCDAVEPQPWRNGGGLTRELLAWPCARRLGAAHQRGRHPRRRAVLGLPRRGPLVRGARRRRRAARPARRPAQRGDRRRAAGLSRRGRAALRAARRADARPEPDDPPRCRPRRDAARADRARTSRRARAFARCSPPTR